MRLRHRAQEDVTDGAEAQEADDERPVRVADIAPDEPHAAGSAVLPAIVAAFRQHRRWVAAVVLAVLAATLLAYVLIPRRYTARADLWLDHGFDEPAAATKPGAAPAGSPEARNTEIRLLTSGDLAAEVVDKLGLANLRGVGQPAAGPLVPRETARRAAVAAVRDNLRIGASGGSYAVAVSYAAPDPALATGVLNQLIDNYVEDRRVGGVRGREREGMRAQVAAAHDELIRNEAAVGGYRAATDLIRRQEDTRALRREVAALDAELILARADQAAAEARLGPAHATDATTDAVPSSPRLRELRGQQTTLAAERAAAAGGSGAARGEVAAIDARLAAVARDYGAETRRVARLVATVRAARNRTGLLASASARAKGELEASRAAAAQLGGLAGKANEARARYAAFAQRYEQLVEAQRGHRGTAYVISHAVVRSARSFPNPLVFLLVGLLAALAAAGAATLVLELLTKGFRNRRHLEQVLGVPVIGMVPDLAKVGSADLPGDDPMGPPDYLYNHQRSAFSAAFRSIHTGLRLGRGPHSPRSVAVCSALQEEGKTTVAICLARSAALAGLRVVLVDCDARRPAASRALSPYVEIGLAQVLEDNVQFRRALQCDTPSGAWFLAHGSDRSVANGAINPDAMEELIATLSREFDLIILDTPPALALVEAREIATMADAVLLVARSRRTPVDATRIANDLLLKAGARVTAAALTLVDP